jgi:hypothetical protein
MHQCLQPRCIVPVSAATLYSTSVCIHGILYQCLQPRYNAPVSATTVYCTSVCSHVILYQCLYPRYTVSVSAATMCFTYSYTHSHIKELFVILFHKAFLSSSFWWWHCRSELLEDLTKQVHMFRVSCFVPLLCGFTVCLTSCQTYECFQTVKHFLKTWPFTLDVSYRKFNLTVS